MNYEGKIKELEAQTKQSADRIKQLQAEIDRLRAEAEAKQEAPPVWKPEDGETYYTPRSCGIGRDPWFDSNPVDKYYLKIGKVFKTEQEAEDYDRALTLIETIRRERYKAQGNWSPNELGSYTICWDRFRNRADMHTITWGFTADVFGLWQDFGALEDVIKKYRSDLKWYFTEYLPSVN